MNDFIALVEQIISLAGESANELSDEEASAVNVFIQNALQFIQEKKDEEIPEEPPEVPASDIPSSNVNGFSYNPKTQELLVQFHGPYPQAEGSIYKYSGLSPFLFEILKKGAVPALTTGSNSWGKWWRGKNPSLGSTVNAILKVGKFPYQKVA